MRVIRNKINIFTLLQVAQRPASLDAPLYSDEGGDELRLGDTVEGPSLLPEDVNDIVATDVFQRLSPGRERTCSVLVAEGFDYPTVGAIMGISDYQVRQLLASTRKRLLEAPTGHHMSPMRVWDSRTSTMHYVASSANLGPKKALRVMPWTGFYDVTRERVYLWDILALGPNLALVTHWKSGGKSGYLPFSRTSHVDWLGSARVIGNRYQSQALIDEYPELLRKGVMEMEQQPQSDLEQQLLNAAKLGKFDLVVSTAKTLRTNALKEAMGAELQEASASDRLVALAQELVSVSTVTLASAATLRKDQ
jgi:hypothetical protein